MFTLTRPQREALKRIHVRQIQDRASNLAFALATAAGKLATVQTSAGLQEVLTALRADLPVLMGRPPKYMNLRRLVVPSHDCVLVPVHGCWTGIERDGYTHQ